MQKKLIVFSLFALIFSLFFSNASAQTATNAASRLKEQMQLLKDEKQTTVSKIRDEARAMIQAKRDEFKARLRTIKDEKRKALVERIDAKLISVNIKHTARFTHVLDNLQILLDRMGQDVDVTQAQAAIDAARIAVETQAAKTYTITIATETALKSDVGTVTSQLRHDLMATHKTVVDAKQAVQTLRKDNAIMKKEATDSANL